MAQGLEIVPVTQLNHVTLKSAAYDLNALVSTPEVASHLEQRHLYGVIARHSGSVSASTKVLERATSHMREGVQDTFVLRLVKSARVIGMAAIMPKLGLRKQRTPLPPAIDACIPLLGGRAVDVDDMGANVAVWADNRAGDSYFTAITEGYRFLREQRGDPVWTIEPAGVSLAGLQDAIRMAGYETTVRGYYDHHESRKHAVRLSFLYRANVPAG